MDGSCASTGFAGGGSVNVEGDFKSRNSSSFLRQLSRNGRRRLISTSSTRT
ncbi:MAG: hypothetical protein H5U18_14650 [Rhodobacteraceae bacterium]|nr:hypothetical protein [Paracoccaceae bacterium]